MLMLGVWFMAANMQESTGLQALCLTCAQGEADVAAWVAKRVDMLLQQTARLGLRSRAGCVSYLGASFRTPLQLSETKSDYTVSRLSAACLQRSAKSMQLCSVKRCVAP